MKITLMIIFWLCTLVFSTKAQSQNYFTTYQRLSKDIPYESLKKSVDSLLSLGLKNNSSKEIIAITNDFSRRIFLEHVDDAIVYVTTAIQVKETLQEIDDELAILLYRVGYFHYIKKEYNKAIYYFEKVSTLDINPKRTAQAYCFTGRCYKDVGDYHKSEQYYKNGIGILENIKEHTSLVNEYLGLAAVYDRINTLENLQSKRIILGKAQELLKMLPFSYRTQVAINNSYGILYTHPATFDFEKGKSYYLKNLKLSLDRNDTQRICNTYGNLSDIYNLAKKDSAYYYALESLRYCSSDLHKAKSNHQISKFHSNKGDYKKALESIQESLVSIADFPEHIKDTVSKAHLDTLKNEDYILTALNQKSRLAYQLYADTQDASYAELSLTTVKIADHLIDIIQERSLEEKSRFLWREEASKTYIEGVKAASVLNDQKSVFYFIEKSKALLLIKDILQNSKKKSLPKEIRDRQKQFKESMLQLQDELSKNKEATALKEKQQQLFDVTRTYEKFQDSLQLNFPDYFSNNPLPIRFDKLQEAIRSNNVVISYIWNISDDQELSVFGMLISNNFSTIFEIEDSAILQNLIQKYRSFLTQAFENYEDQTIFNKTAYDLYLSLFPTEAIRKHIKGKKLTIIPDGDLQSIPFESLIITNDTTTYLIEQHEISYAYSSSFLLQNTSLERNPTKTLATFAPLQFESKNLNRLTNSQTETQEIQLLIPGESYYETAATKDAFLNHTRNIRILHLATHAESASNPWIAFSDSKLELHELYTYQNQAELVVLSACNTSLGQFVAGEGVLSLARGFFYSGANTVVSSLWNVNDKSSVRIMKSFYQNLKRGKSKSTALHLAKLDYLKTNSLSNASPHYWASFTLVGDAETILFKSNTKWYYILSIAVLVLIVFFILIKKQKIG